MPDVILHCPKCNHPLRSPEELLGSLVQCPKCRHIFKTPVRSQGPSAIPVLEPAEDLRRAPPLPDDAPPRAGSDSAAVRRKLMPVGICLLILGMLGLLWSLAQIAELMLNGEANVKAAQEMWGNWAAPADPKVVLRVALVVHGVYCVLYLFMTNGAV